MDIEQEISAIITTVLKHQGLAEAEFTLDSELYDDGIGLDSMCVAELSVMLEKKFGSDPYTSGVLPQTLRDLVNFYG